MASRLARTAVGGAARLRPSMQARALPAISTQVISSRHASSVPQEDPKKKAMTILDSLPGNSLASKAAILSAGAGLSIAAISNEIYVVNEETLVAFSLLVTFWMAAKYGAPAYNDFVASRREKMSAIFKAARDNHTDSVKQRIDNVNQLSGVVDITKTLFEVSKETAHLEAQAYELQQKTAIALEAKAVLDSWVRYEGQVKHRQQKELADTVIAKIEKDLENPKVLKQILDQSVSEVERIMAAK